MSPIPAIFLKHLQEIEPDADFFGSLPLIRSSNGRAYYAKLGLAREREQWEGEAESLKAMHEAAPGIAPRLLAFGVLDSTGNELNPNSANYASGQPFFLSQYLYFASLSAESASTLGSRLATEMHQHKSPHGKFGFHVPTYCGATRFENGWFQTWEECFDAMIGQMLHYLKEQGRFSQLREKGEELRKQ
jgi:protein-ribulosamine 3-kinase